MIDQRKVFKDEIFGTGKETRNKYIITFKNEIENFIDAMTKTYEAWLRFDNSAKNDVEIFSSGLVFNAINNLLASEKLLVLGYTIPSGNLVRQFVESICTAILCLKDKENVKCILENRYSSQKSVQKVSKMSGELGLNKKGMESLRNLYRGYHADSHASWKSLFYCCSMKDDDGMYLGPSFDAGKLEFYQKEFDRRTGLAELLNYIIENTLRYQADILK